ncbi:MAG: hypothetical protein M0Q38_09955 [Bacteroidales bacterium]|jgi:hypothetical protein|nr:hypothetical protein [Bacteroidales bacterium]
MKNRIFLLAVTIKVILTALVFIIPYSGFTQNDIIYKKTGSEIPCKVREITIDLIKYERIDIKKGPIIEIRKQDVSKIRYKNGVVDIIDPNFLIARSDTTLGKNDTTGYSKLYIVFNSGQSSQRFPLIINGQYVCNMGNHSRLEYKMFYSGDITVCRKVMKKTAPCRQFTVQRGHDYGIRIEVTSEYALDLNDRFSMTLFYDTESVKDFKQFEYYGFKPFKGDDYHFVKK